jgi:iron complex transport system permease protein
MEGKAYLTTPLRALTVAGALIALAGLASLALGAQHLPPYAVWQALTEPAGREADVIVRNLRFPRTLLGLLVGAALGVAGVLTQSVTRNPLAEPGLFGVSAGAALAVVVGARLGLGGSVATTVWWALAGAVVAGLFVYLLGTRPLGPSLPASPVTLAVVGVATSAGLAALTSALVLLDARTLDAYRFWAVGSLAGRSADVVTQVLPFAAVGVACAVAATRGLDALGLGDDVAASLGVRLIRLRVLSLTSIGLLTAAGVAACGPIAFLGLMVGHLARFAVGPRHVWLLPLSALLGATVLLVADVAGRLVAGSGELQAGVVLGVVGGPFFVVMASRRRLSL